MTDDSDEKSPPVRLRSRFTVGGHLFKESKVARNCGVGSLPPGPRRLCASQQGLVDGVVCVTSYSNVVCIIYGRVNPAEKERKSSDSFHLECLGFFGQSLVFLVGIFAIAVSRFSSF